MPRCDTCHRMQSSSEVRKLPGRDAHRCKDKYACLLAETNSDSYTLVIEIAIPAKNMQEARQIGLELANDKRQIVPMKLVEIRDPDSLTVAVE